MVAISLMEKVHSKSLKYTFLYQFKSTNLNGSAEHAFLLLLKNVENQSSLLNRKIK